MQLSVSTLSSSPPTAVTLPSTLSSSCYFSSVSWANSSTLALALVSRNQSSLAVLLCTAPSYTCTLVHTDADWWGVARGAAPPRVQGGAMVLTTALRCWSGGQVVRWSGDQVR